MSISPKLLREYILELILSFFFYVQDDEEETDFLNTQLLKFYENQQPTKINQETDFAHHICGMYLYFLFELYIFSFFLSELSYIVSVVNNFFCSLVFI